MALAISKRNHSAHMIMFIALCHYNLH